MNPKYRLTLLQSKMSRHVNITSLPLFFFFFFFFLGLAVSKLPPNQTTTMKKVYDLLQNNTAQSYFPWNLTEHPNPCSWKGVTCSSNNGNNGLINSTKPENSAKSSKKKISILLIIVLPVLVVSFALGFALGVLAVMFSSFWKKILIPVKLSGHFYRVKSHWITDDNIHKSQIDFSKAMEEVCNPANFMMKSEFCTYYRAAMSYGMSYCIKRLNWCSKAFELLSPDKFVQELMVLGRLSNSNIMVPLAYTLTSRCALVFYEYPQLGSLFDLLHGSTENILNWEDRYSISVGIARGLAFLHGCSTSTGPVSLLHLSTKTIFMKSPREPLIGDLELGKVINPSKTMGTVSVIAGSVGYIPPEYAYTMRVTSSANVYGFGIILLELITGKPAISEGTELAKWVLSRSIHYDKGEEILDCRISSTSTAVQDQMISVLRIALDCINVSADERPSAENLHVRLLDVAQQSSHGIELRVL